MKGVEIAIYFSITNWAIIVGPFITFIGFDLFYPWVVELQKTHKVLGSCLFLFRFVFLIPFGMVCIAPIRTITLLGLHIGIVESMALLKMRAREQTSLLVQMYQEMQIINTVVQRVGQFGTGVFFAASFFAMLIGAVVAITSIRSNHLTVFIPAIWMTIFMWVLLELVFYCGCSQLKISKQLLREWKIETEFKKGCGHKNTFRVVLSLRRLAAPAGSVGIIDENIKINFLNLYLNSLVSFLLAFR